MKKWMEINLGSFGHVFSDLCKGLKVAPYDRINEHARFFFSIALRYINCIRFYHNRRRSRSVCTWWRWRWNRVQWGNGSVVSQAVVPAYDAKTKHVPLVVENLEALGARGGGKAGDDLDLPESADSTVAVNHMTTFEKVLVRLRIIEPPHHGPHRRDRSVDNLDHSGTALFRSDVVRVMPRNRIWHRHRRRVRHAAPFLPLHRHRASVTVHNRWGDATAWIAARIDSMKLNRRRHSPKISLSLCCPFSLSKNQWLFCLLPRKLGLS